jgi:hypothetical protein
VVTCGLGADLCVFGIRGVGRAVFVWGDFVGFLCGGCVVGFSWICIDIGRVLGKIGFRNRTRG